MKSLIAVSGRTSLPSYISYEEGTSSTKLGFCSDMGMVHASLHWEIDPLLTIDWNTWSLQHHVTAILDVLGPLAVPSIFDAKEKVLPVGPAEPVQSALVSPQHEQHPLTLAATPVQPLPSESSASCLEVTPKPLLLNNSSGE